MQSAISNWQRAINYQLAFNNEKTAAQQLPQLKIENCKLKIATQKGVA